MGSYSALRRHLYLAALARSWLALTAQLQDLWNMAQQAGPFATAMLLFLYLTEKKERLKCQDSQQKVIETMEAFNTVGTALSAAMENRTRATDAMASSLASNNIRLEGVQKSLDSLERRVQ